jgi:predicted transposase YbfD/YdcC
MFVLKQTTDQEESPMESTLCCPTAATSETTARAESGEVVVTPGALLETFAEVPDPRRRQGIRFALSAVLALAACAILANHLSVLAIAEWGTALSQDLLASLGFKDGVTPHQSTIQRLFQRLDPEALSRALTSHFARLTAPSSQLANSEPGQESRGSQGVAFDGKAQRGRLRFDASGCPVHALSAYLHDLGVVLAQEPIESHPRPQSLDQPSTQPSQERPREDQPQMSRPIEEADKAAIDKAEAELSVAPDLLGRLDWHGRVLTGDALFCQRSLCKQVVDSGGDYLFIVKENQPRLYEDISLLFDPPPGLALPLDDRREARTVDHGHGRHYDTRVLVASTDLKGYSDWPYLDQVFSLERTWREKGQTKREVRFGVTSLPKEVADAERLLELKRAHWRIENCDHYVKDVTLGEDRSLIHLGNGPSVLATLRDLALSILHRAGYRAIASRLRYHSTHPKEAVALFLGQNA